MSFAPEARIIELMTKPFDRGVDAIADKPRLIRRDDPRARRSRAALQAALLDLLDTTQFDQISIRAITKQANVTYPVFFRQFTDKDDLLADVATEQVRALLARSMDAFDPWSKEPLIKLCGYVEAHRKLWTTLLTGGASKAMRAEFSRIASEAPTSRHPTNPMLPPELVTELVTNAIFDILTWWLRQDEDYPVENVIRLIQALVLKVYMRPIDIELL